jgi:hypothetical protein
MGAAKGKSSSSKGVSGTVHSMGGKAYGAAMAAKKGKGKKVRTMGK